jgi:uncharacterized membrane protein
MDMLLFAGALVGFISTDLFLHMIVAGAVGLEGTTTGQRLSSLFIAGILQIVIIILVKKFFSPAFFHGFIVAAGLFLSFDIVVVHWIFHLHRITNGPEAEYLEPILVVVGLVILLYGLRRERKRKVGIRTSA